MGIILALASWGVFLLLISLRLSDINDVLREIRDLLRKKP